MAKKDNFKEYSRLRDIVVKRNKRAFEAGLMPQVHFPTVKEIKAGVVTESEARRYIEEYYSTGSQVRAIRQTGNVPEVKQFRQMQDETDSQRKEKRKKQQREYRQRKRIRANAPDAKKAERYERYLKALKTVSRTWSEHGMEFPLSLDDMTPKDAQAFVEYMDFRFSQGDYDQKYVIDEFMQDFGRLAAKGHKPTDIVRDFNEFLEMRVGMEGRSEGMEGITEDQMLGYWSTFADNELDDFEEDW